MPRTAICMPCLLPLQLHASLRCGRGGPFHKKCFEAAERTRADIAEARRLWNQLKAKLDVRRLVFLDETWTKTNMARLFAVVCVASAWLLGSRMAAGRSRPSWPGYA